MENTSPQRTQIYDSSITDSSRWDRITTRPGDVFICTPPKSGTTWTQSICAMLIFGDPDVDPGLGTISPWLEAKHLEFAQVIERINAQEHRRYLKSHTPLDGIQFDPECIYLVVHRHPMDTHFSMRKHAYNMRNAPFMRMYPENVSEGFRLFLDTQFDPNEIDAVTVEFLVRHYLSYRRYAHLPNVHMFHFADLKRDLKREMTRMACAMGNAYEDELMDRMVGAATFTNMKKNAKRYVPNSGKGFWKNDSEFLSNGSNNKWVDLLSAQEIASYDRRMDELLDAEDRNWLEYGSQGKLSEIDRIGR